VQTSWVRFCARNPASPGKVGESQETALKTTSDSIATPIPCAKQRWLALHPGVFCPTIGGLDYTGMQSCAPQPAFSLASHSQSSSPWPRRLRRAAPMRKHGRRGRIRQRSRMGRWR
jgi:hypothetical protein